MPLLLQEFGCLWSAWRTSQSAPGIPTQGMQHQWRLPARCIGAFPTSLCFLDTLWSGWWVSWAVALSFLLVSCSGSLQLQRTNMMWHITTLSLRLSLSRRSFCLWARRKSLLLYVFFCAVFTLCDFPVRKACSVDGIGITEVLLCLIFVVHLHCSQSIPCARCD